MRRAALGLWRRTRPLLLAAAAAAVLPVTVAEAACGDRACAVTAPDGAVLGEYRLHRPDTAAPGAPLGAVIFVHGWQATADAMMRSQRLLAMADRLGVLLVVPQGLSKTWSYPGSPARNRDEFAFFDALRRDVVARHGADPDRLMITGFSMGASMAWFVACAQGAFYAAAAPMAGAFWDPIPGECPSPPRVLAHLHGLDDGVVPIEGRPIGQRYRQSDAWASFDALRGSAAPPQDWNRTDRVGPDRYDCAVWRAAAAATRDGQSRVYEFCRHDGGHLWRTSWIERVWRDFVAAGPPPSGG